MRLDDFRKSDNVEDQTSGGGSFGGGSIKLGGGALVVIVIVSLFFGVNPLTLIGDMQSGAPPVGQPAPGYGPQSGNTGPGARPGAPANPSKELAARVLGDTEDVWGAVFQTMGKTYLPPTLVLFPGSVRSACGLASAAVGPFYCPADHKLYLDTAFFDELARRFKAPGDFAQAYVIAHEVGHHVQNLTGVMQQVDARRQRTDERGNNALSVRLELQADCYAGVWAYFAQHRNKLDTATWKRGKQRRRLSATIRSRSARRAMSCRTRSRTARRRSASTGSRPVLRAATCASATPSPRASPERACFTPVPMP